MLSNNECALVNLYCISTSAVGGVYSAKDTSGLPFRPSTLTGSVGRTRAGGLRLPGFHHSLRSW
jgi:hypothetical protein